MLITLPFINDRCIISYDNYDFKKNNKKASSLVLYPFLAFVAFFFMIKEKRGIFHQYQSVMTEIEKELSEDENPLDALELPKSVYKFAVAARKLHDTRYKTVMEQYKQERIALEKKYVEQTNSFFVERKAIIDGEKDVPEVVGIFLL
jgi:hypothetical protein